jgi:hypothetical protein
MNENCGLFLNHLPADAANADPGLAESHIRRFGISVRVSGAGLLNLVSGSDCFALVRYISGFYAVPRIPPQSSLRFALLRLLYAFSRRNSIGARERKCIYE